MNVLLPAIGTSGDVFPQIGLAAALATRGHRVTLIANDHFKEHALRLGLNFVSVGTKEDYRRSFADPLFWDWRYSLPRLMEHLIVPALEPVYHAIERNLIPGETVVVTSSLAFGARVARETHDFPLVSVFISPISLRSHHDAPLLHPLFLRGLPASWMRLQYWLNDALVIDPVQGGPLNAFRARFKLPPAKGILREWHLSPDLVLGAFPEWYWPSPPDLPPQTRFTGFILYDGKEGAPDDGLQKFLEAGEPPIAFTPGSAMRHGSRFFGQAVKACLDLGCRGLLMSPYADQIPKHLPPSIHQGTYAPFSWLFPRVSAVVHHGGAGTTARALAAGVPQLVMPMAYDQHDNAMRVKRLGVGNSILPCAFRGHRVARKLRALLDSPRVAESCQKWACRFPSAEAVLSDSCRLIEQAGQGRLASKAA
jgi:rhamnosyltransferase subunit B